jgi:hypothetical protein
VGKIDVGGIRGVLLEWGVAFGWLGGSGWLAIHHGDRISWIFGVRKDEQFIPELSWLFGRLGKLMA